MPTPTDLQPTPTPTFNPLASTAPTCPHCDGTIRFHVGHDHRTDAICEDLAPWACLDCGEWGIGDELEGDT